ncbi:hypothetical protein B0J11DRAFT_394842, partial [Dendryphion nanum]
TGQPKYAVVRRKSVFNCALSVADHYTLTEDDGMLYVLLVRQLTGVCIIVLAFLISGNRIEYRGSGFEEVNIWK